MLRQSQSKTGASSDDNQIAAEIAAKIEFLIATEVALRNGEILKMSDLQSAYQNILEEHGVGSMTCNRKVLKELIKTEIDEVQFHRPERVNESDRVTIKDTRDLAVQLSEKVEQQRDVRNVRFNLLGKSSLNAFLSLFKIFIHNFLSLSKITSNLLH